MPTLKFEKFGGSIPVAGDRALPDGYAVDAVNTWLYGGELRGVRPPVDLQNVNNTTKKVFRIPKGTVGGDPAEPTLVPPPSYLGDSVWMQFDDPDVDIVRSPLVNDSHKRFYWCSPSTGPMYNTYARLLVGDPGWKLGVTPPAGTPFTLGVVGGVGGVVTRAYVITFETIYGEESAPSTPVTASGPVDGSWNLAAIVQPVPDATRAAIDKINIYRTITAASGVATYFKVATIVPPAATYNDTIVDTVVAGNLSLATVNFTMPPADLQGFILMPNGFLIGWKGSEIYFSEPYYLHAWPVEYIQAVEYPVVGLGVFGQTCVVCTQGFPTAVSASKPISASFVKSTVKEPCLSRASIISTPEGVYYASQNGLMAVTSAGLNNITEKIITREDWLSSFTPQYIRAVRYQNGYLALRAIPTGVRSGFMIDPTSLQVALTEFSELDTVVNLHDDVWSGEVFLIEAAGGVNKVQRWDPPGATMWPTRWKSKEFQLPFKRNIGAYALYWDEARFADNALGTDIIASGVRARFLVWCNRVLVYDQPVPVNGGAVKLPSGFKGDVWQFEIRARAPVYAAHVANSAKELRNA